MQIKNFEDLEIWQAARRLAQEIYTCSQSHKFSKDFALRDQMQRAAVSVMSNIAEGFERGGNQEFVQFLWNHGRIYVRNSWNTRRVGTTGTFGT